MKQCRRCKEELPLEVFGKRTDRPNSYHSYCLPCRTKRVVDNRLAKYEAVDKYKSERGCFFCRVSNPIVLDLHHVDSDEKEKSVSRMISTNRSIADIFVEIDKCAVLCSNCHRLVHAGQLIYSDGLRVGT